MKSVLFLVVFLPAMALTAQEAYSNRKESFWFHENNRISHGFDSDTKDTKRKEGTYLISKEHEVEYLIILWDDKSWDKYCMLRWEWLDVLVLYDKDGAEPPAFLASTTICSMKIICGICLTLLRRVSPHLPR